MENKDNPNIEDVEYEMTDKAFKSDADADAHLGQDANTAESSETTIHSESTETGSSGPSATLGSAPPPGSEDDEEKGIEDIDDVQDLAEGTVEFLEAIRENILVSLYKKQEYMKVNPVILNATLGKMRTNGATKRIELTFTDEEMAVMGVIQDVNLYEMSASYDIVDEKGNIVKPRKQKYIKRWAAFYKELGWEKKIPAWARLLLMAAVVDGMFAFPVLKNWWEGRNKKAPAAPTTEEKKAA